MKVETADDYNLAATLSKLEAFHGVDWEYRKVPVELIDRGRFQPRQAFDRASLEELAQSMRVTGGNVQAVNLRPTDAGRYELIAGERRWRAAQLASIPELNAVVSELSDRQAMIIAFVENVQREKLNAIEEAEGFLRMSEEGGLTHAEIAAATGKSRAVISNAIRLTELHTRVKDLVRQKRLSGAHARTIAALEDRDAQREMASLTVKKQWSVRQLEIEVAKKKSGVVRAAPSTKSKDIQRLEDIVSEHAGYPASVEVQSSGKVRLTFSFADNRGLEAFLRQNGFIGEDEL